MQVFKIGDAAENAYRGAGHAVAAVKDNEVVDIVYVGDFIPEFDPETSGALEKAIADPRMIVPVNSLIPKGEIFFGMCSSWEFVVL
jgi:hypothetical protein